MVLKECWKRLLLAFPHPLSLFCLAVPTQDDWGSVLENSDNLVIVHRCAPKDHGVHGQQLAQDPLNVVPVETLKEHHYLRWWEIHACVKKRGGKYFAKVHISLCSSTELVLSAKVDNSSGQQQLFPDSFQKEKLSSMLR